MEPSKNDLLKVLDISRQLATTTDLQELLSQIERSATQVLDCERATVFVHDTQADELYSFVARDAEIRFSVSQGIAGECFQSGKAVNVPDAQADQRFNPSVDRKTGFHTQSLLSCPLTRCDGTPVGVLQALNKSQGAFDEGDESLIQFFGAQCGVSLQRQLLLQEFAEKQRIQHDLNIAQQIQQGLLPSSAPACESFDIAGWNKPAEETGGDFFDFQPLSEGRVALTVADVTGHGIAPALIAVACRAYVRAIYSLVGAREDGATRINQLLALDLPDDRFVTAFVGLLSPSDNELVYTSAGHGPLVKYKAESDEFVELPTHGLPLGISTDLPYKTPEHVLFSSGDILLVLTDGFFEWENSAGEPFGMGRITEVVREYCRKPADEIIQRVYEALLEFAVGTSQPDDLTAVLVKRT